MKLRTLLLAAIAACAGPLAAQDAAPRPTLLRVTEGSDGTVLALDSAAIARTGDSTFVVNAVYHFPADSARRFDGKMELQALDCAHARARDGSSSYFAGDTPVPLQDTARREARWRPVEAAELPLFQALCGHLLGSFAASLPVTVEAMVLDEPPTAANGPEAAMALARSYPRGLHSAGVGGVAMLRLRITEDGRLDPASLRALWASRPAFAQAALSVARRIRWTPARVDGHPAAAWAFLPIAFYLEP
ncbi:MAG: TonB family protein [Longimicrobiaceae bacterium]